MPSALLSSFPPTRSWSRVLAAGVCLVLCLLAGACAVDHVPPLSQSEPAHPQAVSAPAPAPSTRLHIAEPVALQELPQAMDHAGHGAAPAPTHERKTPDRMEHDHAHH